MEIFRRKCSLIIVLLCILKNKVISGIFIVAPFIQYFMQLTHQQMHIYMLLNEPKFMF